MGQEILRSGGNGVGSGPSSGAPVGRNEAGGERFEAGAKPGIGDFAQALAKLARDGARRGADRALDAVDAALAKGDLVDRGIAEEAIDALDDQRGQMLHQRGVGADHGQRQRAARLLALREAHRFGGRDIGVALADDFGPAADHRALDEAEALEGHPGDVADEVAGRARMTAARGILLGIRNAGTSPSRRTMP